MDRFGDRWLVAGAVLVLVAILASAAVSFRATLTLTRSYDAVAHAYAVTTALDDVLVALLDAETGVRGYVLTGDGVFLRPYQSATPRVDDLLDRLDGLVDDPAQRRRLIVLRREIGEKQAESEAIYSRTQTRGLEAGRARVATGMGRRAMDEVRLVIVGMQGAERQILRQRAARTRVAARNARLSFVVGNGIALALVAAVLGLVGRLLRDRRAREADLVEEQDRLERLVAERTTALAHTNEGLRAEVAERIAAEARLLASAEELERSNRELQDFAFVASHDLQEPLRKIQAFGDRLQQKYAEALGEHGRDYVERMQGAAGRMHVLINDLLTYSRVSTRTQPFERVDLAAVARDTLTDLSERVEATGAHVETGPLPTLDADSTQMRQLAQNLLANALKFHHPDRPPVVRVSSRLTDADGEDAAPEAATHAEIAVADNGIGFDEKYLDKIFTPFQRLHDREAYEGTGIGLAICRRIVERHGGTLTARSREGEGATFVVLLPLTHAPVEAIAV